MRVNYSAILTYTFFDDKHRMSIRGMCMFTNKANDGRNNVCGIKIAQYRKKQNKSQRELADTLQLLGLDIDKNAVQRMEAGKRFVTDIELVYLARALNVSFKDLLDENNI